MPPRFTDGQSLRLWLWEIERQDILTTRSEADQFMGRLCQFLGMTRAGRVYTWITPPSLSSFLPILESHLAMHTWPEDRAAVIDIYSCTTFKVRTAARWIQRELGARWSEAEIRGGRGGFIQYPERMRWPRSGKSKGKSPLPSSS